MRWSEISGLAQNIVVESNVTALKALLSLLQTLSVQIAVKEGRQHKKER